MFDTTMTDSDRSAAMLQVTELIGQYCAWEEKGQRKTLRFPMVGLTAHVFPAPEDGIGSIPSDAESVDVRDLSMRGVGFLANHPFEIGQEIALVIEIGEFDLALSPCQVRWSAKEGDQYRIGVAFDLH